MNMSKAERIEDARERLNAAESRLKEFDYAGAMYEAERCIELTVKALLDKLNINYKTGMCLANKCRSRISYFLSAKRS